MWNSEDDEASSMLRRSAVVEGVEGGAGLEKTGNEAMSEEEC